MAGWVSTGKCGLCGESFSKRGMGKHITACRQRHTLARLQGRGKLRETSLFHMVVEGRYAPDFWLHLELPTDATLVDVDQFLRDIWLECCGHLSAFTIGGVRYELDTGGVDGMWVGAFGPDSLPQSMHVELGKVLRPRAKFHHEYDFGTTTHLTLQVISQYQGQARGKSVQILSRNDMPPIVCEKCGQPATQVCSQCIWDGQGWVCDQHAAKHRCGDDMLLPVVNSPRVGMCGYTGS